MNKKEENKKTTKTNVSIINPKFSKDLSMLSLSFRIQAIADAMLITFSVIFLYQKLDNSLLFVLIFFLVESILSLFGFIFGAKILSKIGIRNSIIIGSIFFMLNYGTFLLFDFDKNIAVILYILTMVIARSIYWTGYHINVSLFTDSGTRGSQIGKMKNLLAIISSVLPFLASLIISKFGFNFLFILCILIYIVSIFPLLKMREVKQNYSFGFFETFKNIFSKKYMKNFFIGFFEGAEAAVKILIWPIIIFLLMKGDISSIGILMSCVLITTLIINAITGKLSDTKDKTSIARLGGFFYALGWVGKMFSITNIHLFIFSTYHNIAESILRVPYESHFYESLSRKGDLIDEYVVMREISTFFGRSFVIISSIAFVYIFPNNLNFILMLGVLASFGMVFSIKKNKIKK